MNFNHFVNWQNINAVNPIIPLLNTVKALSCKYRHKAYSSCSPKMKAPGCVKYIILSVHIKKVAAFVIKTTT